MPHPLIPASSEATAAIAPPSLGSSAPIKPIAVKTYSVKLLPPRPAAPKPEAASKPIAAPIRTAAAAPIAVQAPAAEVEAAASAPSKAARGGWAIQVGAFEDESEAKQRLNSAQNKAGSLLGKASRYTERTTKGEKTYFRARFAGFDRDGAQQVCRQLKRSDIDCMALKI
jgi:D-alanyl-D-alanine carboxypeptidase